jgi:oxygen-independent coproporphyrinogen-3 oxidase
MTALAKAPITQAQLIAKYDGRAPRYTSYPTALQFSPAVTGETYRGWLKQLPMDQPVSLYLHIPFCARLCWYCGCNTRAVNRHEPVSDYVQHLLSEVALLEAALPGRLPVSAIHFGGGTPNMLNSDEMDAIFAALARVFVISSGAEIAAELDPAVLTEDWVRAATSHGLNRASLGVQNLDDAVQRAVNRQETFAEIAVAVGWLRQAGVTSTNLDLMFGLPHQTVENTLSTIDAVLTLRPERIAMFGYAHVPWMKSHQQLIQEAALPGPAERLAQSDAAAKRLDEAGYVRIGLDHFAAPEDELALAVRQGRLKRNFQGYTTDAAPALIGLGASAIGWLPQGYVQNVAQELGWRAAVTAGQLPVARGVAVTPDDRFRAEIIARLMCDLRADLGEICRRHGRDIEELAEPRARLRGFAADGLVRLQREEVMVTDLGRPLVRSICAAFDAYFLPEAGRHAKAL